MIFIKCLGRRWKLYLKLSVSFNILSIKFLGRRWKFVPKRFLSPPREFKRLYGNEMRQTTLENFFKNAKK